MKWAAVLRLVALPVLLLLGGCKTWESTSGAPLRMIEEARPSSVRVTTVDGALVTLKNPLVVNDSIVSGVAPPLGAVVMPPRRGVLDADVNLMEVPRFSGVRTLALAGAIFGASVTWARVQGSVGGSEPRPGPLPKDPALDLVGLVRLLAGWF